jgi:DNA primase
VASSGTALTEHQLGTLKRLTDTLIFSFDQDAAGFNAALRGIRLARQKDFKIKIALLPPEAGKDPDEAVQKNPALWREAVVKTIPVMEYLINRATKNRDLSRVDDKRQVSEILLPEIAATPNLIEREHWLQTIADLLRTDIKVLRGIVSGTAKVSPTPAILGKEKKGDGGKTTLAVEMILGLFLQVPDLQEDFFDQLKIELLPEGELRELYSFINSGYNYSRFLSGADPSYFQWILGKAKTNGFEPLVPLIIRLGMQGETAASGRTSKELRQEMAAQFKILEDDRRQKHRRTLEAEIRRAEKQGDQEAVSKLMKEFLASR